MGLKSIKPTITQRSVKKRAHNASAERRVAPPFITSTFSPPARFPAPPAYPHSASADTVASTRRAMAPPVRAAQKLRCRTDLFYFA